MEYAHMGYAGEASTAQDRPYLARIGEMADEADHIAGYLQGFIDRCRGGGPSDSKGLVAPVPSGHLGQLDRLVQSLSRVDALSRELQSIG